MVKTIVKHYFIDKFISYVLDGFNNVFNVEKCRKLVVGQKYKEIICVQYFNEKYAVGNIREVETRYFECIVAHIKSDSYYINYQGTTHMYIYKDGYDKVIQDADSINRLNNKQYAQVIDNVLHVDSYNSSNSIIDESHIIAVI